jgi:ribulose-phosphate 3-epimerase
MTEVIPAILPKNYEDLKNKIALVRGIAPIVQVDICDGNFTRSLTWPFLVKAKENLENNSEDGGGEEDFMENSFDLHFQKILNEEEGMPFWEDVDFELDLMVANAVENFDVYTKLGPKRIIFHIEAVGDLEEFKNFLEGIDMYIRDAINIGVAMNPSTPLEDLFPLISHIDFVQCMGNDEIGYNGVELDEAVYERIKILREKYPEVPIAVDIGVNFETASRLVEAGATKLVSGSAIFNSDDIISTIEEFRNL